MHGDLVADAVTVRAVASLDKLYRWASAAARTRRNARRAEGRQGGGRDRGGPARRAEARGGTGRGSGRTDDRGSRRDESCPSRSGGCAWCSVGRRVAPTSQPRASATAGRRRRRGGPAVRRGTRRSVTTERTVRGSARRRQWLQRGRPSLRTCASAVAPPIARRRASLADASGSATGSATRRPSTAGGAWASQVRSLTLDGVAAQARRPRRRRRLAPTVRTVSPRADMRPPWSRGCSMFHVKQCGIGLRRRAAL